MKLQKTYLYDAWSSLVVAGHHYVFLPEKRIYRDGQLVVENDRFLLPDIYFWKGVWYLSGEDGIWTAPSLLETPTLLCPLEYSATTIDISDRGVAVAGLDDGLFVLDSTGLRRVSPIPCNSVRWEGDRLLITAIEPDRILSISSIDGTAEEVKVKLPRDFIAYDRLPGIEVIETWDTLSVNGVVIDDKICDFRLQPGWLSIVFNDRVCFYNI